MYKTYYKLMHNLYIINNIDFCSAAVLEKPLGHKQTEFEALTESDSRKPHGSPLAITVN